MLMSRDKASSSSTYYEHTKSDYCLCLAIHAPRKGIIKVWKMRNGPRLLAIQCPKGSRILRPSTRFQSSTPPSSYYSPIEVFLLNGSRILQPSTKFQSSTPPSSYYSPLEVFLLNGDSGQLSVLNRYQLK